jgi:antibiotic biosynthesis monooxygenase (ABM) superfamily enzyme
MIPALNAMFDITTTRTAATLDKVPVVIYYLLFIICLTAALMVGYSGGLKPDWTMVLCFSLMISLTVYLIIDLDRPRRGVITMDTANSQIVQLRTMFNNK